MANLITFIIPVIELLAYTWVCCSFVRRQKEYSFKNVNSSGLCFIFTIGLLMLVPVLDIIAHFGIVSGIMLFSMRLMLNVLAIIYLQTFLYKVAMARATEELAKKVNFFESSKRSIVYFNTFILMAVPIATACAEGYRITYRYYWMLALAYTVSTIYIFYLWTGTKIRSRHWMFFTALNAIYWWLYWRIGIAYYHYGDNSIVPFVAITKFLRIVPLFFVSEGRFSDSCVYDVEEK